MQALLEHAITEYKIVQNEPSCYSVVSTTKQSESG